MSDTSIIATCARAAHEANRAYCESIGDHSQHAWEAAPEWQRESAVQGVAGILAGAVTSPEQSHQGWLDKKLSDGWSYGPVKDPEQKRHPCMVSYGELPPEQRAKDAIFFAVVNAVAAATATQPAHDEEIEDAFMVANLNGVLICVHQVCYWRGWRDCEKRNDAAADRAPAEASPGPADEDRANCVERMRELLSELGDQVEMVAAIEAPPAGERWVKQTRLHREGELPGNCYASCLASVLGVPLDTVPQPGDADRNDWGDYWLRLSDWLSREHGVQVVRINLPQPLPASDDAEAWPYWASSGCTDGPAGLAILSGKSPRGDHNHSVVVRGTDLFHDPHPSNAGLDGGFIALEFLVPLDPAARPEVPPPPAPDLTLLNQLSVLVKDAYTEGWVTTGAYSSRDSWEKSAVSRRLCTLLGNITEGGPTT